MPQHRVRALAGGRKALTGRSYVSMSSLPCGLTWRAVKARRTGAAEPAAVLPAGCVAVPVMDLLDEQVDLTPARYVPGAGVSGGVQLRDSWPQFEDLLHTLSELADLLSRFDLAGEDGTAVTTTVGDLDRAQALTVHAGRETSAGLTRLEVPSEGAVPMLTVPDLLTRRQTP